MPFPTDRSIDRLIAVMGTTGSGKSSFVNVARQADTPLLVSWLVDYSNELNTAKVTAGGGTDLVSRGDSTRNSVTTRISSVLESSNDENLFRHKETMVRSTTEGSATGDEKDSAHKSNSTLELSQDVNIWSSEAMCTTTIRRIDGRKVVLIDTPGFDNTKVSGAVLLGHLASELHKLFQAGIHISGVLYLHQITAKINSPMWGHNLLRESKVRLSTEYTSFPKPSQIPLRLLEQPQLRLDYLTVAGRAWFW
jgi:hypothetical protein